MESIGSSTATGAILGSNQVTSSWFYDIPRFVAGKYHGKKYNGNPGTDYIVRWASNATD